MKSLMFGINFLLLALAFFRLALLILKFKKSPSYGFFHQSLGHCVVIIFLISLNMWLPPIKNLELALVAAFLATLPGVVLSHLGREQTIKRRASTRIPIVAFLLGLYFGDVLYLIFFYAICLMLSYYFLFQQRHQHLFIWRNFLWFFITSFPLVILCYVRVHLSLSQLELIIMAGFFIPYWFYTKLLNAVTVADYFEKKLA